MTTLEQPNAVLTSEAEAEAAVRAIYADGELSDSLHRAALSAWAFAEELRKDGDNVDSELYAKKMMPKLGEAGLLGTMIPVRYGGQGQGCQHNVVVQEQLAAVVPSLAVLRAVSGIFVAQPLQHFGSSAQAQRWLPGIANGSITASLAVTEPDAGSDALSMTTRAVPVDGGYELSGTKHFICSPSEAAFVFVYCVTDPEAPRDGRYSAFIVPTDLPGVDPGEKIPTVGVRGVNHSAIRFDRIRLNATEHLVGAEGQGLQILQYGLVPERIDIAARAVGCARGAYLEACRHAKGREQFGRPLRKFQAVSHRIAEMATRVRAAALLTMNAAQLFDRGIDAATYAAMAKLFAAEEGFAVCDDAMQILASKGYAVGQSPVEMLFRDSRVLRLAGGTDDIMRHIIQSDVLR